MKKKYRISYLKIRSILAFLKQQYSDKDNKIIIWVAKYKTANPIDSYFYNKFFKAGKLIFELLLFFFFFSKDLLLKIYLFIYLL